MSKLDDARNIINNVDLEMIELFKKRMNAAKMVAEYKSEFNMPIFDEARESAIIEKNKNNLNDKELEKYYLEWFNTMLKVSKDYQKDLIGDKNA